MARYGYLLNPNYLPPKEFGLTWTFERWENPTESSIYIGIEIFDDEVTSNEDFVIIGSSSEFNEWLMTGNEPEFLVL